MKLNDIIRLISVSSLTVWFCASAVAQPTSLASRYDFVTIDHPGAVATYPLGINGKRQIAGYYVDPAGVAHPFVYKGGNFTPIDVPGASTQPGAGAAAGGINDSGDIVGTYTEDTKTGPLQHGFRLGRPAGCEGDDDNNEGNCKPVLTIIDVPGAAHTQGIQFEFGFGLGTNAIGINNRGAITGLYATTGQYALGFVLSGGNYRPIDNPAASHIPGLGTKLFGINNRGFIAGDYMTPNPVAPTMAPPLTHGFLLQGNQFTAIDVPDSEKGGFGTQVNGVNDFNVVVGLFSDPTGFGHGLVWFSGKPYTLDYPGQPFTELHSISNRGEITGAYLSDPNGPVHGFIAIPKDR